MGVGRRRAAMRSSPEWSRGRPRRSSRSPPLRPPTFGRFLPLALGSAESRSDLRVRPRIAPDSPPSFGQAGIRLQCHLARRRVTYVASAWRHTSCSGPIIDASEARRHLIEISESAGRLITHAWRRGRILIIAAPWREYVFPPTFVALWRRAEDEALADHLRLGRTAPSTCAATCSATYGADGCGSSGTRSPGYGQTSPSASIRRAPVPCSGSPARGRDALPALEQCR